MREETEALDDQGTTQEEAVELLQILHEEVFDSNDEKLALALGRTTEEVMAWLSGAQTIHTDVLLKARALIIERGDSSTEC
jgi:predicted RNase H-like HicB family nuclease